MVQYRMEELIELYYNPKIGLTSPYKLYFKLNKRIPLKTIEEFVEKQESYQRKFQRNRPKVFKPIVTYSANDQWQIDLFDFSRYSHWNSGYKYLLCCVDVFSRKAFVSAIKKKSKRKVFTELSTTRPKTDLGQAGTFKVYTPRDTLRIGDRVRILKNKTASRKGYEPTFGKTIYQIYKGDGYTFGLRDEFGAPLVRMYKVYDLQKITTSEKYIHQNPVRERHLTQQQRRNKRELEDLLEHSVEPLNKKRKIFTGNYFLG